MRLLNRWPGIPGSRTPKWKTTDEQVTPIWLPGRDAEWRATLPGRTRRPR